MSAQAVGAAAGAHARRIKAAFEAAHPGPRPYEDAMVLTIVDEYIRIVENTHVPVVDILKS